MRSACDLLPVTIKALTAQVFALDRIFFRATKSAVSDQPHSLYDARKALTAQARCRTTIKILLALRAAAEKSQNSSERTIQEPKIPFSDNSLPNSRPVAPAPIPSPVPAPGRPLPRRTPRGATKWSPERRARQAEAIRTWQPWRKSTGPRTQDGKTRAAKNALKHGDRSRAHIESRRKDRRVLKRSAHNLAAAKLLLGTISRQSNGLPALTGLAAPKPRLAAPKRCSSEGGSGEGGSPNWYWPPEPRADTVSPRNFSGNRGPGGTSRRQTLANAPRRRWRIAS